MVEGKEAVNEAIDYLQGINPLPPLEWDDNLTLSALEHVMDIGPKGLVSYQSSDGTEPEDRITKYGNYVETLGENIDFGPNDAMGVIVSLTLDDGDQERPHRDNLFKSEYKKVGIACGTHKTEYQMCVMDFAYDFIGHNQQEHDEVDDVKENISKTNINNGNIRNNDNFSQNSRTNTSGNASKVDQATANKAQTQVIQQQPPIKVANPKQEESLSKMKTDKIDKNEQQQIKKLEQNLLNNNANSNFNGNKENSIGQNRNLQNNNQSPLVKLSLEREDFNHLRDDKNNDDLINAVKLLNNEKKVVSKLVEITHKIVYTYEDGSKKETIEVQNHKFDFSN